MIKLIAAVAQNGVIGANGKIPWRLPEDLKRFKALTMGHALVMGRKTYESIGRPLPGRTTIVLSRTRVIQEWVPGSFPLGMLAATTMRSLDEALRSYRESPLEQDLFICGGAEVYRAALEADVVDEMLITHIREDFEGDVTFPFDFYRELPEWEVISEIQTPLVVPGIGFDFVTYRRKRS